MMVSYGRTRLIPIFQAGEVDTYLPELSWVRLGRMHSLNFVSLPWSIALK